MNSHHPDALRYPVVQPVPRLADDRGWFVPVWQASTEPHGRPWVQDNISLSCRGVLRGLHFQHPGSQAKLLTVLQGEIFDVVVDIRPDSPEFGKARCLMLRATEAQQLFIPRGYAHGFFVLSTDAIVYYKVDAPWVSDCEHTLCWNDSQLGINWPLTTSPILSSKDAAGRPLHSFARHELPSMADD
jgi:dTDP-4-dehydrorhamnose 3,5-epimerase